MQADESSFNLTKEEETITNFQFLNQRKQNFAKLSRRSEKILTTKLQVRHRIRQRGKENQLRCSRQKKSTQIRSGAPQKSSSNLSLTKKKKKREQSESMSKRKRERRIELPLEPLIYQAVNKVKISVLSLSLSLNLVDCYLFISLEMKVIKVGQQERDAMAIAKMRREVTVGGREETVMVNGETSRYRSMRPETRQSRDVW